MKNLLAAFLLIAVFSMAGFSQQQRGPRLLQPGDAPPIDNTRPRPNNPNNPNRPNNPNNARGQANINPRRPVIEDMVISYYISQFQQVAQVSDEVFAKALPLLREFVQQRFEASNRKNRAVNALRQMIQQGSSDEDMRRAIREFDKADVDNQANEEKFLAGVDPLLNTQQQAKVRIFLPMTDQRIRQMLDAIQNGNQPKD